MPTFETPEPIFAVIEVPVGAVRVKASERADTVVDVSPSNPSESADVTMAEQTQVEYAQGRLLVKTPKVRARWWSFGAGPSVVVTVELPAGSRVDADTKYADVRCEGRLGETEVENSFGDIWLDQGERLRLHTNWGGITVGRAAERIEATTSGGEVRIDEIDGTGVVKNGHGGITIGTAIGDLRLNTSSGGITVDRSLADIAAKTAYGAVRIGEVVRGSINAETSYGRLEFGIAEGTAVWLDVSSQHGHVDSTLDAADAPAPTDETAEVRGRTGYGEILIRRSLNRSAK
ncbi:MAG TPA: DUF4097 family beta strand repeat-containing protein [Streptosporangiaceae bacterium]|jgi:hypothetical protein